MNKQHILNEIRRTAAENGGTPLGRLRFERETGIKYTDWCGKIWARWSDAVKEAGHEPNALQTAYSENFLVERLVFLIRELGHYPVTDEIKLKAFNDKSFPWHNTFARLGTKTQTIDKLRKYCIAHPGHEDILAICDTHLSPSTPIRKEPAEGEPDIGYVYLMKSGKHYKIGRSVSAGQRERQLAIQMPAKLVTVHTIRTDDPPGIEAYWHGRFAGKRKNGEWFDLSSADVKAFKRRKFM